MSEEFRKAILNRLAPATKAPWADDDEEEEELADELGELGGASATKKATIEPLSASEFFAQALEINPPGSDTTFRAYLTPPKAVPSSPGRPAASTSSLAKPAPGPPGGGLNPTQAPWATSAVSPGASVAAALPSSAPATFPGKVPSAMGTSGSAPGMGSVTAPGQSRNPHGTFFVLHHGAGASGLSFAALAKEIAARGPEYGVLAFDARGHGKTRTESADKSRDTDLSLPTLIADLAGVIRHTFPDPKAAPSLILVGHSMGAAPCIDAAPLLQAEGYAVAGVAALDIVEGTAVESLPLMKSILSKRPAAFASVPTAIQWHLDSGSIRNATSARVSVPSYVVLRDAGDAHGDGTQVWRTDLVATEPFWLGWYEGLSRRFLAARCARILVLAGQERLDNDLIVGQMQGKFQLEVMTDVGHFLHEDDPATLATTLVNFARRNTQVLVLPPKIGQTSSKPVEVKHVGET